jgi:CRP-like cAMP-binding protein
MIHNFGDSNEFSHLFRKEIIPSKTTLLEEGKMANTIYFIEQGCIRSWFNNNGKDITVQFFFEEDQVASIESFRTNRPSLFSIESIEKKPQSPTAYSSDR